MENPAPFDLNEAVRQWRHSLQNAPALRGQDLDELEGHLRESAEALRAQGLGAEEAYAVALRRLGTRLELETEFAKVNPRQVWADRAVWMLCGLLATDVIAALVAPIANTVLSLGMYHGLNVNLVCALELITRWLAWGACISVGFFLLTRQHGWRAAAARVASRWPVWTAGALIFALEVLQLSPRYVIRFLTPLWQHGVENPSQFFSPHNQAIIQSWLLRSWIFVQFACLAAVPLLAGYIRKQNRLWLERGFWMLTGTVLNRILGALVLLPPWALLVIAHPSAAVSQNLACFGSMCLGLLLLAAALVGLSNFVVYRDRQSRWVGRFCCERPIVAAAALVVCVGILGGACYALARTFLTVSGFPAQVTSQWYPWYLALTQLILPTSLLLWLAKRTSLLAHATT
jgi:hypothetical protein